MTAAGRRDRRVMAGPDAAPCPECGFWMDKSRLACHIYRFHTRPNDLSDARGAAKRNNHGKWMHVYELIYGSGEAAERAVREMEREDKRKTTGGNVTGR